MGYEVHVVCDRCGIAYWSGESSKALAASIMRDKGWTIGKRWLCPNCKKSKTPNKINRGAIAAERRKDENHKDYCGAWFYPAAGNAAG